MSTRKKWATTWDNPALGRHSHPSRTAAYDYVASKADMLRRGITLRAAPIVTVWVDERLGHGWERYERVDLREHAAARAMTPDLQASRDSEQATDHQGS